jgi:hypothetical protein
LAALRARALCAPIFLSLAFIQYVTFLKSHKSSYVCLCMILFGSGRSTRPCAVRAHLFRLIKSQNRRWAPLLTSLLASNSRYPCKCRAFYHRTTEAYREYFPELDCGKIVVGGKNPGEKTEDLRSLYYKNCPAIGMIVI